MSDPVFYGAPLTFNAKNHRYTWKGMPVPSVTTIINRLSKPLLIQWAANKAAEHFEREIDGHVGPIGSTQLAAIREEARMAHVAIKETAGDVGKLVHKYAQAALTGKREPTDLPPAAQKGVEAFWQWVEAHKIEPLAVERRVMSKQFMYAGTCDFYGFIDGELSVLDFKTGNGVYDEAWWQTSGYSYAIREEMKPGGPIKRWIIHLNKTNGEFVPHSRGIEDELPDMDVWLGLIRLDSALRLARKHPQAKRKAA